MYNKIVKTIAKDKKEDAERAIMITEKILDIFNAEKVNVGEANAVLTTLTKLINEEV